MQLPGRAAACPRGGGACSPAKTEDTMADFRAPLRRSRSNRMVAGVVAGLAEYVGMDVTLARVLFVLASIVSAAFPGVIVYLILWAVMPEGV